VLASKVSPHALLLLLLIAAVRFHITGAAPLRRHRHDECPNRPSVLKFAL